ncbi:MAG TPA: amidohydrolase [Longimicrobium sp.]|nr:amidohydrolase [Longimicrobium sp.]
MTIADETGLLVHTRRDLHRHPELGFQEFRTAGIVAERLRAAGYEVRTGIAETGVIGTLHGGAGHGPTLLLRADMDALPVDEETTHDFGSTVQGKMHACGHDAHVAIGLAVAERLARSRGEWAGTVKYMFQPAEEGLGGALGMIEAGVLDGVDAALGLHVWLGLESGVVGVVPGPQMAGAIEFGVTVRGRGGHGAMPHETIDALHAASQVIVGLQSVVSRTVPPLEPAVVTVASLHAGAAHNVIAETAVMRGTVRAFDPALLADLPGRVERVIAGVCAAMGAEYEFTHRVEGPPTVNDPRIAGIVRREAVRLVGADRVRTDPDVRTMAAEDFGDVLARVPGCYFFVGGRSEARGMTHPHHSPRFDLCEDCMPVAVDVLEASARAYLAGADRAGADQTPRLIS